MSTVTNSIPSNDPFRLQFDPQQPFIQGQQSGGVIDNIDLYYRGPHTANQRKVSIRGVDAYMNRIIMYFSSLKGDYLRSDRGNEFAFVYNAPRSGATRFRIISTVLSIMSRRFPDAAVTDVGADYRESRSSRGWGIRLHLIPPNSNTAVGLDIPL